MQRGFFSETAANALGTLLAIAVVYLAGVIAGAFTARALLLVLASIIAGFVLLFWVMGLFARSGWARPWRWGSGTGSSPVGGSPKGRGDRPR